MIGIGPMPAGGATAGREDRSRLTERHVLALGLAVSGLLVAAAAIAAAGAVLAGGSPWVAIHLAMAGAATVAIGTFMPHFAVTLAGTRPRPPAERATTLALLSTGAMAAVVGVAVVGPWLAGAGTIVMLGGLAFNLGVGAAWAGAWLGAGIAVGIGAALVGWAVVLSLALLLRALTVARY